MQKKHLEKQCMKMVASSVQYEPKTRAKGGCSERIFRQTGRAVADEIPSLKEIPPQQSIIPLQLQYICLKRL